MSGSKVIYFKDVKNGARVLSNQYNIKEVDGVFWEVEVIREEEDGEEEKDKEWALVKDFGLRSKYSDRSSFWKEYNGAHRPDNGLPREHKPDRSPADAKYLEGKLKDNDKTSEERKGWWVPVQKAVDQWKNIDEAEFTLKRTVW